MSNTRRELRRLRVIGFVLGGVALAWLAVEDRNENWAVVFAAVACAWIAAWTYYRQAGRPSGDRAEAVKITLPSFWFQFGVGVVAGLAVIPVAWLIMLFKSGLHGHPVPEYTIAQYLSVLARAPFWIAGAVLLALSHGVWRKLREPPA